MYPHQREHKRLPQRQKQNLKLPQKRKLERVDLAVIPIPPMKKALLTRKSHCIKLAMSKKALVILILIKAIVNPQ